MQAAALSAVLATTAMAAPHPFYQSMLQRGVAQAKDGRYADAIRSLRIAAFGSIDDLASYQLAQVHLAIAHEKLGNSTDARLAATKFIQAERLQPSYDQLALTDAARESFEKIVAAAVEPHYLAQVPSFRRGVQKPAGAVATRGNDLPIPPQPQPEKKPEATVPPPQQPKQQPVQQQPKQTTNQAPSAVSLTPVKTSTVVPAPAAVAPAQPKAQLPTPAPMQSANAQPTITAPKPQLPPPAAPATSSKQPAATPQPSELTTRLAEAQRLLNEGKLLGARNSYIALSQRRDTARPQLLEIARGLNRTGAWQESAMIYQRALPLLKGEELHMFYEAVNRYELGELTLARTLLGKALPSIPRSREVEAYRVKIQGAS
ncbi:MAG TPA: hypothetical protein VF111_12820 [Thermoanaerobaculia bacterium]